MQRLLFNKTRELAASTTGIGGNMIQEKTFTTLEYDKILSILKQHLASEVGHEFAEKLRPATSLKEAETLQRNLNLGSGEHLAPAPGERRSSGFPDVREMVGRMHASLFLSTRELLAIAQALRAAREAKEVLQSGDENSLLCNLANRLTSHRSVRKKLRVASSARTRFRTTPRRSWSVPQIQLSGMKPGTKICLRYAEVKYLICPNMKEILV